MSRPCRGTTGGCKSPVSTGSQRQPRRSTEGGSQHSLHQEVSDRRKTESKVSDVSGDAAGVCVGSGNDTAATTASSCDSQDEAATACASDSQAGSDVGLMAPTAVRIVGCPEAYKRFEEGVFVHYKDVNGKPSFACQFKNMDEDAVLYAFWWAPERKVFMMGPAAVSGTMSGFFYVPGDGVEDPTKVLMQWISFDTDSGSWAAVPSMRCVEVSL